MHHEGPLAPGDLIAAMLVVACVVVLLSARGTALAENRVTQTVIARETFACQSPWQVLEGSGCRKLSAGTAAHDEAHAAGQTTGYWKPN